MIWGGGLGQKRGKKTQQLLAREKQKLNTNSLPEALIAREIKAIYFDKYCSNIYQQVLLPYWLLYGNHGTSMGVA